MPRLCSQRHYFLHQRESGKDKQTERDEKQPLEEIIDHSSKSLIPSNELLVPSGRESNEKNNTSCHGDTGHRAKQGSQKLYLKRKKEEKKKKRRHYQRNLCLGLKFNKTVLQ